MTASLSHLPLIIIAFCLVPSAVFGHVLDEYLQSTLVVIEPGDIHLRINLTPGVEIAEEVLSQIDHDRDGTISTDEATAYAEIVKRDLTAWLDGREVQFKVIESAIPELDDLRTGQGMIQLAFAIMPSSFTAGNHRLTFHDRHFDALGVYLFNAARPRSASIRIVNQHRNRTQSKGEIEFAYAPSSFLSFQSVGSVASLAALLLAIFAAAWRLSRSPGNLPRETFEGK